MDSIQINAYIGFFNPVFANFITKKIEIADPNESSLAMSENNHVAEQDSDSDPHLRTQSNGDAESTIDTYQDQV